MQVFSFLVVSLNLIKTFREINQTFIFWYSEILLEEFGYLGSTGSKNSSTLEWSFTRDREKPDFGILINMTASAG
jgi:hypothetical protein